MLFVFFSGLHSDVLVTMDVEPSDTSSEASYFEQEPVSGAVLLDQELLHREACAERGNVLTGCEELDNHVLLGGLARGGVVGLSAEEDSFGLLVRLLQPYMCGKHVSNRCIVRTTGHCPALSCGRSTA